MKKREKAIITISVIALVLIVLLTIDVIFRGPISSFDSSINLALTSIQIPGFLEISNLIDLIFDPQPIIIFGLILAGILWFFYSKKEAKFLALTMLSSGIIILAMKQIIRIPRPTNSLIENNFLSFPSGHAAITLVLLGIFGYWIFKKYNSRLVRLITTVLALVLVAIVGFSRIYLNTHWFSDILGGFFLGIFILGANIFLRKLY